MDKVRLLQKESKPIFWYFCVFILLVPALSIFPDIISIDGSLRTILADTVSILINLLATFALFLAASNSKNLSKRLYWGWIFLAIAQFSFAIGDIFWAIISFVQKSPPFPSIADLMYLLYYPLFSLGIFFFSWGGLNLQESKKRILDLLIVFVTATLVYWIFLINPIIQQNVGISVLASIITLAYPVGDLILLFGLLLLFYNQFSHLSFGSVFCMCLGIIVTIFSDSVYSHQILTGIYKSGGILDYGWEISYYLFGIAAFFQIFSTKTNHEYLFISEKLRQRQEVTIRIVSNFPYLSVIFSYILLLIFHDANSQLNTYVVSIGVGCLLLLVIRRQIHVLNENEKLLESVRLSLQKVGEQAAELDQSNRKLRQEIDERNRVEEKLSYTALHDGLTGLANRHLFMDRLNQVIKKSQQDVNRHFSILYLDLDDFKTISDGLGHSAGDLALIEFGKRLTACTRSADTLARVSGDEFAILIEYGDDENFGMKLIERIFLELERPFHFNGKATVLSCSIGIVQGISAYINTEDLMRDANLAMYSAKEKGKARVDVFDHTIGFPAIARLEIENDLRRAIEKCEFYLDYQPIYSLVENCAVGFEALVRWRHPKRGIIMPGDFIDIAEKTGLIIPLGEWILKEAISQTKKWQVKYPSQEHLWISINISGKQIVQKNFVENIMAILSITGVDPRRLELEITENTYIESQSIVNSYISDLRGKGIGFMIDDFGTGYSSFGYLKNISANKIKIDKSFVFDLLKSKNNIEIIKTIIQMAHSLGMETVAEGIENEEQLLILKSMNCEYGQGFYLSKPMNIDKIESAMENDRLLPVFSLE